MRVPAFLCPNYYSREGEIWCFGPGLKCSGSDKGVVKGNASFCLVITSLPSPPLAKECKFCEHKAKCL
jgi:hypothetical protein